VSPILIRPVREQLEHDRLIRFLQLKYQKKFEVHINAGEGQAAPVKLAGPAPFFPDLVLLSASKIAGLVEVETGESTNNLEALAQWQHFGRARVPFHLYVPVLMFDAARRFCDAHRVAVTEIWTYRSLYDGFDLVRVFHDPSVVAKLLPPVVNTRVEPERDQKQEMANLVELANRTFKAAAGKSAAAAAAAKAAAAQARAANKAAAKAASAAKAVPPVAPVVAPKVPAAPAKPEKAVPPASKAPAPVAKAVKPAAKASTPKPAAKPVKPAAKAAKPAAKVSKPAPKPIAKKARKPAVAAKPKKAAKKAAGKKR